MSRASSTGAHGVHGNTHAKLPYCTPKLTRHENLKKLATCDEDGPGQIFSIPVPPLPPGPCP